MQALLPSGGKSGSTDLALAAVDKIDFAEQRCLWTRREDQRESVFLAHIFHRLNGQFDGTLLNAVFPDVGQAPYSAKSSSNRMWTGFAFHRSQPPAGCPLAFRDGSCQNADNDDDDHGGSQQQQ